MGNEKSRAKAQTATCDVTLRIYRATAMAAVLILWGGPAWAATLTWNANSEPDVAGYRVYQCSQQPCGRTAATATLLATLGKVTSFNIGTPVVVQYYVITAYDFVNNESSESSVTTYTPAGAPPPPPPPVTPPTLPPVAGTVTLTVLGSPNLDQAWSVQATTNATGTVSMQVWINGALDHTDNTSPYCAFGDSGGACTRVQKPSGNYTVEFRALSGGTEVARQSVTVAATVVANPPPLVPPPAPANLRIGFSN